MAKSVKKSVSKSLKKSVKKSVSKSLKNKLRRTKNRFSRKVGKRRNGGGDDDDKNKDKREVVKGDVREVVKGNVDVDVDKTEYPDLYNNLGTVKYLNEKKKYENYDDDDDLSGPLDDDDDDNSGVVFGTDFYGRKTITLKDKKPSSNGYAKYNHPKYKHPVENDEGYVSNVKKYMK